MYAHDRPARMHCSKHNALCSLRKCMRTTGPPKVFVKDLILFGKMSDSAESPADRARRLARKRKQRQSEKATPVMPPSASVADPAALRRSRQRQRMAASRREELRLDISESSKKTSQTTFFPISNTSQCSHHREELIFHTVTCRSANCL